jgi:hypothetical protein
MTPKCSNGLRRKGLRLGAFRRGGRPGAPAGLLGPAGHGRGFLAHTRAGKGRKGPCRASWGLMLASGAGKALVLALGALLARTSPAKRLLGKLGASRAGAGLHKRPGPGGRWAPKLCRFSTVSLAENQQGGRQGQIPGLHPDRLVCLRGCCSDRRATRIGGVKAAP